MMKQTLLALALIGASALSQAATEGFANVSALPGQGWQFINASTPPGSTTGWVQGDVKVFTAQDGPDNSYISANYNNAAPGGTLDNTMLTPFFSTFNFGDISFYARAAADPGYSDTLTYGLVDDAGNFTLAQTFTVPTDGWQSYTLHFDGTGSNTRSRFGIRYSGLADNANYVGVDSLTISVPEPSTNLMLGIGLIGLIATRRRKPRPSHAV